MNKLEKMEGMILQYGIEDIIWILTAIGGIDESRARKRVENILIQAELQQLNKS